MVLLGNGKVIVWGNNEIQSLGKSRFDINIIFDRKCIRKPRELHSLNEIEFIHINDHACFAIDKNYNVLAWGQNEFGQLGIKRSFFSKPKNSELLSKLKIIRITSDLNLLYLLSTDGKVIYLWKEF